MSNVRSITPSTADLLADGLEKVARDIRSGKLAARRALVVVSWPDGAGDDTVGLIHFGHETSVPMLAGMLEVAKLQAIDAAAR